MKEGFKEVFVNEEAFEKAFSISNFIDGYIKEYEVKDNQDDHFEKISEYNELIKRKKELNNKLKKLKEKFKGQRNNPEIKNINQEINKINDDLKHGKENLQTIIKFKIENPKEFSDALLIFSLKYYQIIDGFKYFALSNNTNFIILNETLLEDINVIKTSIKVASGVSFSNDAGEQGGKVSIKLK